METFVKLYHAIMERTDIGSSAKLVYSAIRDREGRNGAAWPGIRRLARDCGLNWKAVQRAICELEASGDLGVIRGTCGKPNSYCTRNGSAPETGAHPKREGGVPETGAQAHPKRVCNQNRPINQNTPLPPKGGFWATPSRRKTRAELKAELEAEKKLKADAETQRIAAEDAELRRMYAKRHKESRNGRAAASKPSNPISDTTGGEVAPESPVARLRGIVHE